ncbi:glycoside hydrolase family 25 protein [Flavobacterium pallidum]|uniref:Glycoside hydrolase n=1 Tax=Flavobacterium pallidum TaxID=2172098 RepID=A0A2S1SH62_9FLAO|nr:glycoside hydrolase family 25 protein [Flavobacterium pallidum]AWI25687.1 glycoside hydrolase [Flavobacterium pallidum]
MMRKTVSRSRTSRKSKSKAWKPWLSGLVIILLLMAIAYHYREGLAYYFSFKSHVNDKQEKEARRVSMIRNVEIMSRYSGNVLGIDVSEYQGEIVWDQVGTIENNFPIGFVLVRATAGDDRADNTFSENWKAAKAHHFIRGAYHYYRPDENSLVQAKLFIQTVQLRRGDLPPVLDIEKLPKGQSIDSLKVGLRRWLRKIEGHYGVKPIIYSGEKYYNDFLKDAFHGYKFWIANYNFFEEKIKKDWLFWQFTEKAAADGIEGYVDVNVFNGNAVQLDFVRIGM